MQLSELLGSTVRAADGARLGTVIDVRLCIGGDPNDHPAMPEVFGLIVSPRTSSSFLGYERSNVQQPSLLAALLRFRHRGTFLSLWSDVDRIEGKEVRLRGGAVGYSPVLRSDQKIS
ncbi:hypothetical protein ASG82_24490 [Mycobacterium sp. Soil538]|nr:hypothetical protein ASG82_24490 [Mycobacterium sp. Soil538]